MPQLTVNTMMMIPIQPSTSTSFRNPRQATSAQTTPMPMVPTYSGRSKYWRMVAPLPVIITMMKATSVM